jgi:hypothetical protein
MDDERSIPTVTVIGTCRVHHPLRAIEEKGLIHLNNGGMGSFVHSSPEALVRLKVLLGMKTYEEHLLKLQVGESKEIKLKPDEGFDFSNSDILVIEISTIKAISFFDNPLQVNEINRHMCTPHGEFGKMLRHNLSQSFNGRKEYVDMPEIEIPESYPIDYIEIINNLKPVVLSEKEIFEDLKDISSLIKIPILIVNHINLPGRDGKPITSRNKLCNIINKYSEIENVAVFNPVEIFNRHKREDLLMKNGEDLNHYAKKNLLTVGNEQLRHINSILN